MACRVELVFEPSLDCFDLRLQFVLARFQSGEFFRVLCFLCVGAAFGGVESLLACVLRFLGCLVACVLCVLVDACDLVLDVSELLVERRALLQVSGQLDGSEDDLLLLLEDKPLVRLCRCRQRLG